MSNLIDGLIIGARKCGTTWLYENFRLDDLITVSEKVKESGFFSLKEVHDSTKSGYLKLIDRFESKRKKCVEVDTSIVYSPYFVSNINLHASDAAVVLILRKPEDYLVSRIIHSIRKGEIKRDTVELIMENNSWLRDEIDYLSIMNRFKNINTKHKLVVPFELLEIDDVEFYSLIKSCLIKLDQKKHFEPKIRNKINVSRSSRLPLLTIIITRAAILFRTMRLHAAVNFFKRLGFHSFFEVHNSDEDLRQLKIEAKEYIFNNYESSNQIWNRVADEYI